MNFDFEFVEPAFGTFGEKINGTWNGVVGDLSIGVTNYCPLTTRYSKNYRVNKTIFRILTWQLQQL